MLTWDETVEDESLASTEGTGSQFSSDSSSGLMLELNKLMDNENRTQDHILGNWIIAPSRCLFTFRPVRQVGLPLVLCSRTIESSNQVILDIFGGQHQHHQEMITMTDITGLSDKYLAYSNGGWLLFCRPSSTGYGESLFLHNIVTGAYIDLPDIRGPERSCVYLFSMAASSSFASSVDYIVNVTRKPCTRQTTIYVTRPDTGSWEVYTIKHERERHKFTSLDRCEFVAAIIFRKKVYVFDHSKRVVVFDLVEKRWWSVTVTGFQRQRYGFHVAESDGKIVKIYSPQNGLNRYRFFSLEWDDEEYRASWVEMSESELENKSWFLGRQRSRTCCIKDCRENGGQAAVYQFTYEKASTNAGYAMNIQAHDLKTSTKHTVPPFPVFTNAGYAMNIQVHDLKTGTTHTVLPFPVFSSIMYGWVYLGYSQESRV